MNGEDIVWKFIIMGLAIYTAASEAESEAPESMTITATTNDNKIIEITIAIKEGEEDE